MVLTLLWCGGAHAQTDTTRPAVTLNSAQGTTTFTSLPSPLRGSVFDVGGMGSMWISLQRQHSPSAAIEKWNGTSWGLGQYPWTASIAPPDADHTSAWSVNIPWPTGADLPDGRYALFVQSYDKAGNRTDIVRSVLIGPNDTTAPALTLDAPTNNYLIDSAQETLTSINGTVGDAGGVGVAYVQVSIARLWYGHADIQWWNGTSWQGPHSLVTTLGAPDATGTRNWSLTQNLPPPAQLETGQYFITALAYDKSGNRAVVQHKLHVAPRDTTTPTVSVSFPAENQQLYRLPELRGTSADEGSGVSDVRVWLQRSLQETGGTRTEYWNGLAWAPSFSYGGVLLPNTETGWTRNRNLPLGANLPPGDYSVVAQALDRYYNVGSAYRNFRIIAIAPLSIDAHIRATAAQPWLGEGFSNADASGQTLAGTLASDETQTRQIRLVRSGGDASKTVKVTIPDWAAFAAAGWTASFSDEQSGADITAQITSAQGWQTVTNDGDSRQLRANVTAPANATAGQTRALTFRVEADATSETPALDVVKATWTVTTPTPDLAIRADNGVWPGENVRNADGTNQTLERVADSSHVVRGQIKLSVANAQNGQVVTWSVPDGDAFRADGWQAKFFDVTNGNTEISGLITGEGWTTTHTNGIEPVIGWEVTAPANASDVTRALSVRAQVGGDVADVVKASVRVLSNVRPDVSLSALDENGLPGDWVGEDELSPIEQRVAKVWGAGETYAFALRIKNIGTQAAAFPLTAPTLPGGWSLKITDALEGGNLLAGEMVTPTLAPNQSVSWRVEVTASAAAPLANLAFRFDGKDFSDEIAIDAALQKLASIQWSVDNQTWTDVTPQTLIPAEQMDTVGVRAIKSVPNLPWPDSAPLGPTWTFQGKTFKGTTLWLHAVDLTDADGDTATATLDKTLSLQIKVVRGNAFITYDTP